MEGSVRTVGRGYLVVDEGGRGINAGAARVDDDATRVLTTFPGGGSATIIEDGVVLDVDGDSGVGSLLDGDAVDAIVKDDVILDDESAGIIGSAGGVDTLTIVDVVLQVGAVDIATGAEVSNSRGLVEGHVVAVRVDNVSLDFMGARALALGESDGRGG